MNFLNRLRRGLSYWLNGLGSGFDSPGMGRGFGGGFGRGFGRGGGRGMRRRQRMYGRRIFLDESGFVNKNTVGQETETGLDGKAEKIYELLPKLNCRTCGYPSCMDCARAIASGNAPPDACRISGAQIKDKIKAILEGG